MRLGKLRPPITINSERELLSVIKIRGYKAAFAAAALAVLISSPAFAAPVSEYAEWSVSGQAGTAALPGSDFPVGTFTSDATRLRVAGGTSAWLGTGTPFGAHFGSSRGHGYLFFGTGRSNGPSTTTVTFSSPTPVGWGFALGDIDADQAQISATGANGALLTAAQLGWQGAFNFCESSPKPPACSGPGPFTDKPTWNPATATLTGNVNDTDGASGWFMPTVPVKSLTILFSVQSGIPVAQLWMAAKWEAGKPDIVVRKAAEPTRVLPGGKITYTVRVTNEGTVSEPYAEFSDDLRDVLDDAHYLHDARTDGGSVTLSGSVLRWHGPVAPGQTRTITYSVRVDNPPRGNKRIQNAVIGDGPRLTCQRGKGHDCATTVIIRHPRPVVVFCRAAEPGAPMVVDGRFRAACLRSALSHRAGSPRHLGEGATGRIRSPT
jgi:hypothetical protein